MNNVNHHDSTRENGNGKSDDSLTPGPVPNDYAVEQVPRSTVPLSEDELAEYRIDQSHEDFDHGPKMRGVAVRRPGKSWFRVSPTFGRSDCAYGIVEHDREYYLVKKHVHAELRRSVVPRFLYLCVTPSGEHFLWPAPAKTDWATSARRAVEAGKTSFVRLHAEDGQYAFVQAPAAGELASLHPDFAQGDDEAIINQAFEGRVIDSPDHPVARKLLGWIA